MFLAFSMSLWPLALIASILAAFFLTVFLYRLFYKKNMNRALDGEATSGLIDLGSLVKTLAFVALLVMSIVSLNRINTLTNQISNTESNLLSQISYLRSQISSLDSEMEEYYDSLELIQSSSYELVDVDLTNDVYSYSVEFSLLEKETDADVYLVIEKEGVSTNTLLTSTSLTYQETIVLDYDLEEYTVNVMIEGDTVVQKRLFNIDVDRDSTRVIGFGVSFIESEEDFLLFAFVRDEIYLEDTITIDSVTMNFYKDNILKKTDFLSDSTSMVTLLEPYENGYYEYEEFEDDDVFGIFYNAEDFGDFEVEFIITLSNGTIITRTYVL